MLSLKRAGKSPFVKMVIQTKIALVGEDKEFKFEKGDLSKGQIRKERIKKDVRYQE